MQGSFNSSQINACVVGIGVLGPRFTVSSEGLGLQKMLLPRGFEPSTFRMPGKHRTTWPRHPAETISNDRQLKTGHQLAQAMKVEIDADKAHFTKNP